MIAHIEVFNKLSLSYTTVGYTELDSNDIDRHNNLTFIGEQKIRSVYDIPDDLLRIFDGLYRISILNQSGLSYISMSKQINLNDAIRNKLLKQENY